MLHSNASHLKKTGTTDYKVHQFKYVLAVEQHTAEQYLQWAEQNPESISLGAIYYEILARTALRTNFLYEADLETELRCFTKRILELTVTHNICLN